MSHIIVASDSFKGSLSSQEVATTISKAILSIHKDAEITELCISDGGEGFAEAVTKAMKGVLVDVNVHDALLRPICAQYGIINGNCAVMDVASTIGLTL